ncbi:hypothetical protein BCR41DRAFT_394729 [Lobosporangium transversale]|uniref:Uncharacterized protein n=1 Tax=Lobosporangium transversale TaxID=64571 RepID=A0A1Y2GRQ0_9FUNG|nr:hypothetical protein BCR41DRAFT_394729 [Lobosporangium transversale]ORZ20817.1 hypothetical protein BCR41DRAFT_394729 [Lobosporangium transversale]|eukprot:XP_021882726.1 hypothetical protein BCR41DRAFT_394729 [Lobosporangium transversale]
MIPMFEATLVIGLPDVLLAGPRILLSASQAGTSVTPIQAWSHFYSSSATTKKLSTVNKNIYHTTFASVDERVSMLSITVSPPTIEQCSYLCEAIVSQALASKTSRIILVAATNFVPKENHTYLVEIHDRGTSSIPQVSKELALGDHILNTFLTLFNFINIPSTTLLHPARKGVSLKELEAIIGSMAASLASLIGDQDLIQFSAKKAIESNLEEERLDERVDHVLYI